MNAYAHTPPRDRRRGKRILTMRNTMFFSLAVLVCFTMISVASELQKPGGEQYGRLWATRQPVTAIEPKKAPTVIEERTIPEYTNADPMTLDSINREQILGVTDPVDPVRAERDAIVQAEMQRASSFAPDEKLSLAPAPEKKKARFAISGGSGGVYMSQAQ